MSQEMQVKLETLQKIKGDIDKKDSLLIIAERQFALFRSALFIQDSTIKVYRKQVALKEKNEALCVTNFDILYKENKDLEKLNNKLNFKVKLFKGTTIAIPILIGGTFAYFTFIK